MRSTILKLRHVQSSNLKIKIVFVVFPRKFLFFGQANRLFQDVCMQIEKRVLQNQIILSANTHETMHKSRHVCPAATFSYSFSFSVFFF